MRASALLLLVAGCKGQPALVDASPPLASSAPPVASSAPSSAPSATQKPGPRPGPSGDTIYDFDHDTLGAAPAGMTSSRTGTIGRVGTWIVQSEPTDGGGTNQFVTQTDTDPTDGRFAVLATDAPHDFAKISVMCKPISGKVDQSCGLVCGLKDPDDYYLARANALEGNVRFYVVEAGKRKQLASWSGKVTAGEWHRLQFDCRGGAFNVHWDGTSVITAKDKTLPTLGKVGLWTKADSVTAFDYLEIGIFSNQ